MQVTVVKNNYKAYRPKHFEIDAFSVASCSKDPITGAVLEITIRFVLDGRIYRAGLNLEEAESLLKDLKSYTGK